MKEKKSLRQCPVCGKTVTDKRVSSHTHYWAGKAYDVTLITVVGGVYAKRILARP